MDDTDKKVLDELVTRLVRKGQPLTHIYAEHEKEMPISLRSLYNYIDAGEMTIKNIDLRRKTSYKQRRQNKKGIPEGFANQEYRQCRTYEDFERLMKLVDEDLTVEMDTVKGVREKGKRLLTMIFRKNSVMLLFLMPDGTATSVKRIFDYLEAGLGTEVFQRLFPYVLTDNGGEFKKVDELELTEESVVVATLFHDLCKVNFYKKDVRNQKINGTWQEVPCYTIEEKYCFGGHGSKSVYLVQQFMKLKTDEAAAINCHMGATSGGDSVRDTSNAYAAFPLAWVTHVADEAATYLLKR